MKWILVERKPDIVQTAAEEIYLGKDGSETTDARQALMFPTREAAEAHRRTLKKRYSWVTRSADD